MLRIPKLIKSLEAISKTSISVPGSIRSPRAVRIGRAEKNRGRLEGREKRRGQALL